jgi:hypothetical protein
MLRSALGSSCVRMSSNPSRPWRMSRSRYLHSAKIGARGIKRPWSLHGSRCPGPIHQMLPASSSRHRHHLSMQEIDRRIVIVKDLFPPVHQALRIIAILAFAARTFWHPPGPHVGLSHVRLGAACACGGPTNISCHTSVLTLPIRSCTPRRSMARHWTMRAADACSNPYSAVGRMCGVPRAAQLQPRSLTGAPQSKCSAARRGWGGLEGRGPPVSWRERFGPRR